MTHPAISLLLLLFLLIVMPVWGWLDMRRLKREKSSVALTHTYLTTIGTMWLLALLAAVLAPRWALWTPPGDIVASSGLGVIPVGALIGLCVGLMIGLIVPVILARLKPDSIQSQLEPIRFMLPTTRAQRWLFVVVCLTAGICEEWIYRGFALHLFAAELPNVNAWWLIAAQAVMFGIAHAYQGRAGTILTGILGVIFGALYVGTGSLLLPMIMHALVDLRILLLLPALRAQD
jgi:membrane protease YdiL (CAAX protease family)